MTRHRIGIDLGGTKIEIAVLAPDGSERHRHRIDTPHGYQASLEGIAGLVRDAEAQLGVTATVGIGIPGVISPATGLVKNANSIALNGHTFDRDISALLGPRGAGGERRQLLRAVRGERWRRRRPWHGVRRHPRHRLRRRRGDRRQGAARSQPRHRRVGPQPAALAAAGRKSLAGIAGAAIGAAWRPGSPAPRWRATATARARTTPPASPPAPPPARRGRRRRSTATPIGWRAGWRT